MARRPSQLEWAEDWFRAASREERAVAAAAGLTELMTWLRLLPDPAPGERLDPRYRFMYPGYALMLDARAELEVLDSSEHTLHRVVVSDFDRTDDAVAYLALVATLSLRRAPVAIVTWFADTGVHVDHEVDDSLLRRGIAFGLQGLAARANQAGVASIALDAKPGRHCGRCPRSYEDCAPGVTWLAEGRAFHLGPPNDEDE